MPYRIVSHVVWAKECQRPTCIPVSKRSRGSKALGLSYEKRFARELQRSLPNAKHGQWYNYLADGKLGYCQPDVVVPFTNVMLLLECKLRNVEEAQGQLIQLYMPIIRAVYQDRQVRAIIVARSLTSLPSDVLVARNLAEAILLCKSDVIPVLHWLGKGPI